MENKILLRGLNTVIRLEGWGTIKIRELGDVCVCGEWCVCVWGLNFRAEYGEGQESQRVGEMQR